MAPNKGRRKFLQAAAAFTALSQARAADSNLPRLGVVVSASDPFGVDRALAKVNRLGFPSCQLGVGMSSPDLAPAIREASAKYHVEVTALMTLGTGRMVWNLKDGPLTIGIVPPATRPARMDALRRASDLAKNCGVNAIHTHCGFIPENPNEPLYAESVAAVKEVAKHCQANGQTFLCETGQESPITLLRLIQDTGLNNIGVNLDLANLILYGKGEPVGALDVLGPYVKGTHAKDGLYPTDPYGLGKETPIGQGRVRFPEVMAKLHQLSYTGPLTIEREISGPRQETDIQESKLYLENLIRREYGSR